MKIGIVCYPSYGGSGVVATALGKALASLGHQIHFITHAWPVKLSFLTKNIYFHQVTVEHYPLFDYPPYDLALSSKLLAVVEGEKLDVLHVHYAIPHAYAAYMAQKMLEVKGVYIPFITTLHGTDISLVGSHPSLKPAVTFSIDQSDAVTAVSRSLRTETYARFGVQKAIEVIYNFIDPESALPKSTCCERAVLAAEHERIIAHVSNFRPVKRIQDVIEVFSGIQKALPAVLLMVGEGPERVPAQNRVHELGLTAKVKFLGDSVEVDEILSHSDLFLLPSEKESFGLAALEAMAFRTPVISSDVGGLAEVNREGFSGFLSPKGAVEEMTRKALSILRDDTILQRFKDQASQVARRFDCSAIVPQYEALYEAVIRDKADARGG